MQFDSLLWECNVDYLLQTCIECIGTNNRLTQELHWKFSEFENDYVTNYKQFDTSHFRCNLFSNYFQFDSNQFHKNNMAQTYIISLVEIAI